MPLIATKGAASAQGFGEFAQTTAPVYIEDVFSTYLYTGNGTSSQTITNSIDMSGKGAMLWIKRRNNAQANVLFDSQRGVSNYLVSNDTVAQASASYISSFNANGFTLGNNWAETNASGGTYTSWTFREQPKFFDVVTYTGTGSTRSVSHSLDSTPGCIIIKCTSNADQWMVYHRSLGTSKFLYLNTTGSEQTFSWISSVGSTSFTLEGDSSLYNASGRTYVAYLFAHDAGGFGLTGSDNVITCGSFTPASNPTVNLGWEPQWVLYKPYTSNLFNWAIADNMRGFTVGYAKELFPNTSGAEADDSTNSLKITNTGFTAIGNRTEYGPILYIAIRRGPMKTPTTGTSVFTPVIGTSSQSSPEYLAFNAGFPIDLNIIKDKANVGNNYAGTRLTGKGISLYTNATNAEDTGTINTYDNQSGLGFTTSYDVSTWIGWMFRRAPGFFDVVCYTGTGSATTQTHNLGVAPELVIVKSRSQTIAWRVWASALTPQQNQYTLTLNGAGSWSSEGDAVWGATLTGTPSMTSSSFSLGTYIGVNNSGSTYVAYLFASVAGVSKVGSYTGSGATKQIDCGFTAGARFVLIKRTDSTGDWYVWDSARGIVSGNDPYLLLNSTAAEVTNTDYVDTYSAGFEISSTAPAAINANGGTFIFLAIA